MNQRRIDIGAIRRDQIVSASAAIIAEQGIQHLSLSAIEKKVRMSRGQLTYWFKSKEDILLAVFDRMLLLMFQQHQEMQGQAPFTSDDWLDVFRHVMREMLKQPPEHAEFQTLHHTFLSQISHRDDFRRRLADLYGHWRGKIAEDVERRPGTDARKKNARKVEPRHLANLVQAILHGLRVQSLVDPDSVEAEPVIELCVDMFRNYLRGDAPKKRAARARPDRSPRATNSRKDTKARRS
ncbi:MAG: TetR/AcrR family transcriptional regulator [Gemmataceae bacterium]|nr:TetR/AcrR family transcriptional regulator [Gemmataceae bacterium]